MSYISARYSSHIKVKYLSTIITRTVISPLPRKYHHCFMSSSTMYMLCQKCRSVWRHYNCYLILFVLLSFSFWPRRLVLCVRDSDYPFVSLNTSYLLYTNSILLHWQSIVVVPFLHRFCIVENVLVSKISNMDDIFNSER